MDDVWNWAFFWDVLPQLLPAVVVTIEATLLGFLLAALLGLVLALLRRSRLRLISVPTTGVVELIRSTPPLIQIYFLYFALPQYGITLSALFVGIFGLGLHYATYCSEVYRAGLDSVPRGQWEAAKSLNLSPYRMYRDVIVPQAIPPVVPALGNYLIAMFKITPILSAIAVVEIMQKAKSIGSETFRYVEPITMVGVFFLVLSLISMAGIRYTEYWLRRKILE